MQRLAMHDERKAEPRRRDERRRPVDHPTYRCICHPDDLLAGEQGAHPVREIDDLRASHAGHEVLVPTGKTRHLVGKHRAANQNLIVWRFPIRIAHESIDSNRDLHRELPFAQRLDLRCRDDPDRRKGLWSVPPVVEDP